MRKILTITAMILMCPVFLTGCWDRREINDIAFVLGTAVDKEGSAYRTSVQVALPGELGGASGKGVSGGKGWYIESALGKTIRLSTSAVQRSNSRELNASTRRSLIIGEELAREGISSMLDIFTRVPQNRLLSVVAVTEGPAYEILNTDALIEPYPSEMVRELILSYTKNPIRIVTLLDELLSEGLDVILPIIKVDPSVPPKVGEVVKNISIDGLAIFKGDQMVGTLKGDLARIIILGMNQNKSIEMTIPAPMGEGTLEILFRHSHVKLVPKIQGDDVTMQVNMQLVGTVTESASDFSPTSNMGMRKLEESVQEKVKSDLTKALAVLQNQYHADSLGFGQTIQRKKPKDWDRLKSRWQDIYPHVKVEIAVDMHLETVGQALEPMGLPEEEVIHD
ncbi:Ger(x)C family spore germination protein [Paenibacillus antarcticus]|nr:Ger(x)C family spore germination protein [Paenibacillus antarcticus]